MRRRVRDTEDERQEKQEKTNASLRRTEGQSDKRIEGERGRRWDYMTPFRDSSFSLASEDWLRGFDENET